MCDHLHGAMRAASRRFWNFSLADPTLRPGDAQRLSGYNRSFRFFDALNRTVFDARMVIGSPVAGFRP